MGDHGLGPVPESVAGRLGCGRVVISINPVIVVESLEGAFVQVRREVCVAAVVDWDVDQRWAVLRQRLLEDRCEFGQRFHAVTAGAERLGVRDDVVVTELWVRDSVATTPPSILMSAPVVLADRSLARKMTRSATSSGVVNRPVAAPLTADATTSSTVWPLPLAFEYASPPAPSHKGVDTGADQIHLSRFTTTQVVIIGGCQFSNKMSSSQFQCRRDVINGMKLRIRGARSTFAGPT